MQNTGAAGVLITYPFQSVEQEGDLCLPAVDLLGKVQLGRMVVLEQGDSLEL